MTVLPDELQNMQRRIEALKPKPDAPKQNKIAPRQKGSRVIDGKVYSPEQVKAMGLERPQTHGGKNRSGGGSRDSGSGLGEAGAIIPRNIPKPGATYREPDSGSAGRARATESFTRDAYRSPTDSYQSIGDGRETERAPGDGHTRAGAGHNVSESITARISKGAAGALNSAFEKMANLGKPRDDDEEHGPSSGNGFHPVERVSEFLEEEYAQPFTTEEADERTQEVIDMIIGYSYDIDEFLSISNADGARAQDDRAQGDTAVWAMDEEEAAPIARIWLKRAKRDRRAAATLRLALQGDDYKRAAIVLGPRLWRTATWYPQHGGFRMQPWESRREPEGGAIR